MWTGAKTLPNKRMKLTKPALVQGAAGFAAYRHC